MLCVLQKPSNKDNNFARELTYNEFYRVFYRMKLYLDSATPPPVPELLTSPSSDLAGSSPTLTKRILPHGDDRSDDELSECCICMDRRAEIALSECNHAFCNQCLEEWTQRNQSCPVCRQHASKDSDVWILTTSPSNEDIFDEFEQFLKQL
jgi:hypothetical protein